MNRIIITGKNSELPRLVSLPFGVAVDGTQFMMKVRLMPHEIPCPECKGAGSFVCSSINPSVRDSIERCDRCKGDGIISKEEPEQ